MTPQTKGTISRVVAGILVGVLLLVIGMVLSNDKEVAALKVRVEKVEEGQRETKAILETNRVENRQEHKDIKDTLDVIAREVRK